MCTVSYYCQEKMAIRIHISLSVCVSVYDSISIHYIYPFIAKKKRYSIPTVLYGIFSCTHLGYALLLPDAHSHEQCYSILMCIQVCTGPIT